MRAKQGGALVFSFDDHIANLLVTEGFEAKDMPQLDLVGPGLPSEVVDLVLEPLLAVLSLLLLLLDEPLQLLKAQFGGQKCFFVVFVLSPKPLYLGLVTFIFSAFLRVFFPIRTPIPFLFNIFSPKKFLSFLQQLIFRCCIMLPVLYKYILLLLDCLLNTVVGTISRSLHLLRALVTLCPALASRFAVFSLFRKTPIILAGVLVGKGGAGVVGRCALGGVALRVGWSLVVRKGCAHGSSSKVSLRIKYKWKIK